MAVMAARATTNRAAAAASAGRGTGTTTTRTPRPGKAPAGKPPAAGPKRPIEPDSCVASTRMELTRLGALSSPEGQAALRLAEALDSGRSVMAAAANAKQLLAIVDTVRAGAR